MLSGVNRSLGRLLTKCFFGIPTRIILSFMGFLAIINAYAMRVCLNITITQMVVKVVHNSTLNNNECPASDNGSKIQLGGDFEWSEGLQGIILSSFFWGYIITHLPGGLLSEKYGGKWTLSLGILSTAILSLLTPVAVQYGGAGGLIAIRVLEGLGEGTTFPALNALIAAWIPLKERSKAGALIFGGSQIGTIFANTISGFLLHHYGGYASPFYFFGVCGIIWFIAFTLICFKDPESHPFISEKEKIFLKKELGQLTRDPTLPPTPWRAILTSGPMIALVIAQIGHDFGYFAMITDLPKYMSDVMKFNVKENGIYSSLPYVLMWIVSLGSGVLSDWMIVRKMISVTNSRKIYTTIASAGPAIFIVIASYAGCDKVLAVVYFTIAMGLMGGYYSGMKVNAIDLSPNYAGVLMAITNGIAACAGIVSPFLIGVLTPNRNLIEWRTVFWVAFVIFNITNLVYIFYASGEVQPWNTPHLMNKSSETSTDMKEKNNKSYEMNTKNKLYESTKKNFSTFL